MLHSTSLRSLLGAVALLVAGAVGTFVLAAPAAAHSYAATVYAAITEPEPGLVRTRLDIEYVLLATDGARALGDTAFEQEAYDDVQASGQDPTKLTTRVLRKYTDTASGYVLPRFTVSVEEGQHAAACPNRLAAPYSIVSYDGVPHVRMVIEADCRALVGEAAPPYRVSTELFPGTAPGGMTTTVVTYDLDSGSGVASLDTDKNPTMTTVQDWGSRMWEFFVLGAEHLLFGIDHILFLLALIVASRRLRDILLVATAFTVAHSVTFILAALGVVNVPARVVEPIIALSIAVVALWHLWGQWRDRRWAPELSDAAEPRALAGLSRVEWLRVGVVFGFGLVHGIGFAGALGIDEQFAWGLLGALLVFNLGIETAQFTIIVLVFPLLVLLRRRVPRAGVWVAVVVSAGVAIAGLFWFVERLFST